MWNSKKTLRQGMTILPAAMIEFSFGFAFGWVAPAMQYLRSVEAPFEVTEEELSWIASVFFVAELLFSMLIGLFARNVGHKPLLLFSAFLQALGWFFGVIAYSPMMTIVGRFLLGAGAGTEDVVWCMYVGEITTPVERGVYGSLFVSTFLGGTMGEFLLSIWLPFEYLSIIPFAISLVAFMMNFFIKESPYLLIKKGKLAEAKANLAWLRGVDDPEQVRQEFDEIKKYLEEEGMTKKNLGIMHVLRKPSQYKVSIVAVLIFTLAQPSGNIAILSFQTVLLELFDNSNLGSQLTVLYGVLQFLFINLSPFVIEKIGRKKPLIFGFSFTTIIHVALTYLFYVGEYHKESIPPYSTYIICGLFNLYGVIFVLTIFPTVYVLKSELFSEEVKSVGNSAATMTNALADFLVVKLFVWIWLTFGLYVNFIVYAGICIVSVVYVLLLIPETKGKTLIEIQEKIGIPTVLLCPPPDAKSDYGTI